MQPLVKVLPVEILSWNLAHRLRRPNEALGFFLWVRIFSGGFTMRLHKETLWSLGSKRLERDGKMKFCRELHWFISGPRNFIQHGWSIGWASNLIFLAQVWNLQIFLIRLLMIFYKFNENIKGELKWSNWVFIELIKYFMKMKPEVTWFGHAWNKRFFKKIFKNWVAINCCNYSKTKRKICKNGKNKLIWKTIVN